jgi:hypothetical protein
VSDCGVCLTSGCEDGYNEFCSVRIRRAAKIHNCSECDKEIRIGERYEYATGRFDGDFWHETTCLVCAEIADAFYCDGRMFGGELWEQMVNTVFPIMTTGCFDRLTTAAAKADLMRRWNEWKFS